MIHSIKELMKFSIRDGEGEIGQVLDFYFDDFDWKVRYLAMETGAWLEGQQVLLSLNTIGRPDMDDRVIPVNVGRDLIRNSPNYGPVHSLTRMQETELHDYFGWPYYWDITTVSGIGPENPIASYPLVELEEDLKAKTTPSEDLDEPNLRSTREVLGYQIQARDGNIGHLEDFLVVDENWKFLYTVADTSTWLFGRKVLVALQWVEQIKWSESAIQVDLKKETIKHSPAYDPAAPLEREFEARLYEHYGRKGYWRQ